MRGAAGCGLLERDALLATGSRFLSGARALRGAAGERDNWCLLRRLQEEGGGTAWDGAVAGTYLLPGCILTFLFPQGAVH